MTIVEGRSSFPEDPDLDVSEEPNGPSDTRRTAILVAAVVLFLLVLVALVVGVATLVRNPGTAEALRDAVIVVLGIQSVITGLAVLVLLIQVARLTALLQNEVRPMLEATNETVQTLRGTTEFLSENVVRPVVRMNGAMAAVRRALELVGLARIR